MVTVCLFYPPLYKMGRVWVIYDPDIYVTGSRVVCIERAVSQLSEASFRAQYGVLEAKLLNVVRQSAWSQYVNVTHCCIKWVAYWSFMTQIFMWQDHG